jgi:hypothetical protein
MLYGSVGRNCDSRLHLVGVNEMDDGHGVLTCLVMHGNYIRACLYKSVYVSLGALDHKMHVKDHIGAFSDYGFTPATDDDERIYIVAKCKK